ncbi:LuxR C-terminal-related transcriptional regulator [Streptomyces sp. NPDC026665]|uniref:LuxR C-terminal-related transcriptional regulator n=1 Tax=Streptomyces sp. NPDC026665 TaxID=3154798 RepID=UPI0033F1E8C9
METQWPLVGRATEQQKIEEILKNGTPRGVIIFGPAGAGKTRLALDSHERAPGRGFHSLFVSATHASSEIPLGAFAPWISPDGNGLTEAHSVLAMAAASLKRVAGNRRLLLCIDDVQFLDSASILLLRQMITHHRAAMVATCREGAAYTHDVMAFWKDGLLARIDLPVLDEDDSAKVAAAVAGDPVDSMTASEIYRLSDGLPLTVRELIISGKEKGQLTFRNGIWSLSGEITAASRLVDLIKERIQESSLPQIDLLQIVALGEPVLLRHLLKDFDVSELEELESRSILAVRKEGDEEEVRFVHPLYSEILRNSLPPLQRRRHIAELMKLYRLDSRYRADVALKLALWSVELGEDPDPAVLLNAALISFAALDLNKTQQLSEASWKAAPTAENSTLLGTVLWMRGRYREAEDVLAVAWSAVRDPQEKAIVGLARATALEGLEKFHEAEELLTRTLAAQNGAKEAGRDLPDLDYGGLLQVRRAKLLLHLSRKAEAEEILDAYQNSPDPYIRWEACITLGLLLAHDGRPADASRVVDSLEPPELHRYSRVLLSHHPIMKDLVRTISLMQSGRIDEAIELLSSGRIENVYRESPSARAMLEGVRGEAELLRGDAREAAGRLTRVLASEVEQGWPLGRTYLQCCLLQAGALTGDKKAMATARSCIGSGDESLAYAVGAQVVAEAWAAAADGEVDAAHQLLTEFLERPDDTRETIRLEAAHSLARLGDAKRAALYVSDIPAPQGPLLSARIQHIEALSHKDAAELERVGGQFETCGAYLLAAESHADASRIHTRHGNKRAAARTMRSSSRMLEHCPEVRTPVSMTVGDAIQLTDRERQIALLAAQNMSSAEIAERLVLSVRTVDNHLQKIFSKLGIKSRRDIRKSLRLDPDTST